MSYQNWVTIQVLMALVPLSTSVAYFMCTPKSISLALRVGTSAHGLFIAVIHLGVAGMGMAKVYGEEYGLPFGVLCAIAGGLIAFSFWRFRGPKAIHLLQAINILWLLGLIFVGGMAVTGRWL